MQHHNGALRSERAGCLARLLLAGGAPVAQRPIRREKHLCPRKHYLSDYQHGNRKCPARASTRLGRKGRQADAFDAEQATTLRPAPATEYPSPWSTLMFFPTCIFGLFVGRCASQGIRRHWQPQPQLPVSDFYLFALLTSRARLRSHHSDARPVLFQVT